MRIRLNGYFLGNKKETDKNSVNEQKSLRQR